MVGLAGAGHSLDVGATYRIESLDFKNDRKKTDTSFSGLEFPMGFALYGREELEGNLTVSGEYVYDAVLRNILTGLVVYRGNLFSFGVGPFFGFLNTSQFWPKVGVASVFKVEWPGIAFVELWLDNSTGSRISDEGDYLQERSSLASGFYVPGAICSVSISKRLFVEQTDTAELTDSVTRYAFSTDIYRKNVPFKILISFALQSLSREWDEPSDTTTQSLYSILLGTRFDIDLNESMKLILDLDSSIYTWGQDELLGISNPGPGGYLFRAVTGLEVDVDKFLANRRGDDSAETAENAPSSTN
jgi:hypothetical protein